MEKIQKKIHLTFLFLLFIMPFQMVLEAKPPKEIENLENLINVTEQHLVDLGELKTLILKYQELQTSYLDHPNNKELLLKTGKSAKHVLEIIKEHHLTHLFDAKFLSELSLFAKMVKKPSLPKN